MKDWVKPHLLDRVKKGLSGVSKREMTYILDQKSEEHSNDEAVYVALTDDFNIHFGVGNIWGGPSQKFREVFGHVLSELPEDVFMKILKMRNVVNLFTPQPGAEVKIISFEHSVKKRESIRIVTIPYVDSFKPLEEIMGAIAHEIAHVYSEHGYIEQIRGERTHEEIEDEADRLAIEWGFAKEIEAIRKSEREETPTRKP